MSLDPRDPKVLEAQWSLNKRWRQSPIHTRYSLWWATPVNRWCMSLVYEQGPQLVGMGDVRTVTPEQIIDMAKELKDA